MELSVFSLSPFLLNNFQKISRILLADVFLFEAPVFGGGALDGDGGPWRRPGRSFLLPFLIDQLCDPV